MVVAYVESPIVKGDLTIATEAFDDDGLPHTLEHLIFLGSEDYPYKGVLDILANRCLADGTNAYTDTDHTNYTLTTAGSDGFLNLLPIYLDHVLFPILTDSAYLTEVHHVNGDGEDAGVVYCEMQATENNGETRCYMELLRELYPGKCGYKSNTGGLMENLRKSTNNVKVRNYHKEFYHSRNLCIVVTGPVEAEEIFKHIKPVEDKIVLKGDHLKEYTRPWQSPVSPLAQSLSKSIQYSSDTDDDGLVYIGWRGPNAVKDYPSLVAISLLLDYLNDTTISPIQRDFVECEDPYCSSVCQSIIENSTSCFYISFESVKKERLNDCKDKLFKLLEKIANKEESFNMERMKTIISRKIVRILSAAETSPHSVVIGAIIGDFLYGDKVVDLEIRCKEIEQLKKYELKDEDFWLTLIKDYFIGPSAKSVCIIGEPSPTLMKSMAADEQTRLQRQKTELESELSNIEQSLKDAIKTNDIPAPISMLNSVKVPSIEKIHFHTIDKHIDNEGKIGFMFLHDSIKTNFIYIRVLMNSSISLTKKERLYLPILSELLLESPIMREGKLIPYEQIVSELYSDTILNRVGLGIGGSLDGLGALGMLFGVVMGVEIAKYNKAVQWYKELLFDTVFNPERVKTIANRMVSDIQQSKRKGGKVASCALTAMIYQSDSNQWAINFARQQKFLKQLVNNLSKNGDGDVINELSAVRNKLVRPENLIVHLSLNKDKIRDKIDDIYRPWNELFMCNFPDAKANSKIDLTKIKMANELVQFIPEPNAAILGVGSVESNYLQQVVKSIDSPEHPDLAAMYVLLKYLTQLEGPLWRHVRGSGLSYNYDITLSVSTGLLLFLLSKSTHVVAAYKKVAEIVNLHIDGKEEFDDSLLESAKSSLIFEFISAEKSAVGKSAQSLECFLRNIDVDYNKKIIQKVSEVTKDDLRRVAPVHLKPLFENLKNCRNVICCHSSKVEEVKKGLKDVHPELAAINLDDTQFISSLE